MQEVDKVPVAIANDYNSHPTIMCKNCKSFTKNLYFLHDEDNGEYYCQAANVKRWEILDLFV